MVVFVNNTRNKGPGIPPMNDEELKTFRRTEDWERLAVLEVRVNDHAQDLKQVFKHQELLSEGIAGINSTLQRILYVMVGAGSLLVIQELGLMNAVMMLVK